jgi:glyoxalase superfamily protein
VSTRFKDVCLDANEPGRLGPFWARALGLTWHTQAGGDGWLSGPTPLHTIWVNAVPEPRTVKARVHLDIYAASLDPLLADGATVLLPQADGRRWTVLADPEGTEFCAFPHEDPPAQRLHGLVVDCADPKAQASWWASVFGEPAVDNGEWWTIERPSGAPFTMDFNVVPEPKTVKNRVHWDVTTTDVAGLLAAGATLLRAPDAEIGWHILADPEGNEFCAFTPKD